MSESPTLSIKATPHLSLVEQLPESSRRHKSVTIKSAMSSSPQRCDRNMDGI